MNIYFWWNSFIEIETKSYTLVCDPWVNEIIPGYGWKPCNNYHIRTVIDLLLRADCLYISHIHYDHLDIELLSLALRMRDNQLTLIIPKLNNNHLINKIRSLNCPKLNIIELAPYQTMNLCNTLIVQMIPQFSESSSQISGIGYEMDSSIMVHSVDTGKTFLNSVYNPLSPSDYKSVISHVCFNPIDLLSIPASSASEYPQSYLGINRSLEAQRVTENLFQNTKSILDIVKPINFIQAGGSYSVSSVLTSLEEYKVMLNETQLDELALITATNHVNLNLCEYVSFSNDGLIIATLPDDFRSLGSLYLQVNSISIDLYDNTNNIYSIARLKDVFQTASEKFFSLVKKNLDLPVSLCNYEFYLYENIPKIDSTGPFSSCY